MFTYAVLSFLPGVCSQLLCGATAEFGTSGILQSAQGYTQRAQPALARGPASTWPSMGLWHQCNRTLPPTRPTTLLASHRGDRCVSLSTGLIRRTFRNFKFDCLQSSLKPLGRMSNPG